MIGATTAVSAAAADAAGAAEGATSVEGYARFQKSLRRSLEVSLYHLKRTNEEAWLLLGLMSLFPGGALPPTSTRSGPPPPPASGPDAT